MELSVTDIIFNHQITGKNEAIALVAGELEKTGFTGAGYLQGMMSREAQISTYLGNGIAIPHGTPETRSEVKKTGVKVGVFPQGVDWGDGNTAYLVMGIAAQGNEHLSILRQLTHALSNDSVPAALASATCAQDILTILHGEATPDPEVVSRPANADNEATFIVNNPHGLHARPSAVLVKTVKQWQSAIQVENLNGDTGAVDAKNLMRVVSLGAKQGHRLRFTASGPDASAALASIGAAFAAGLGEIAAQPNHSVAESLSPAEEKPKRSWLARLFS